MKILNRSAVLLACSALAACDDAGPGHGGSGGAGGEGGGGGCLAEGSGTLEVVINGLPQSVDAVVAVGGQQVSASTSLTLDGGPVAIEVGDASDAHPIVRAVYRGASSAETICVVDGETAAVTVTYELVPTSRKLWASTKNETPHVVAFDRDALGASGTPVPIVTADATTAGGTGAPSAIAFDRQGSLWAAYASGEIRRFPADRIAAGGEPEPDVILSGNGLGQGIPGPTGLAFDADGSLWVSLGADDKVVHFDAEALETTGEPVPSVELSGAALDGPDALAFDEAGNLWVATHADTVVRYDAGRLGASSDAAPDRSLEPMVTGGTAGLGGPAGLAFDEAGNLWGSFFGPNVVARIDAADLAGTGDAQVTPTVQIEIGIAALLGGLALDESGGLWVALGPEGVGRYNASSLGTGGDKSPDTLIGGTNLPDIAFFPAPLDLPLFRSSPPRSSGAGEELDGQLSPPFGGTRGVRAATGIRLD